MKLKLAQLLCVALVTCCVSTPNASASPSAPTAAEKETRVLRHAVFFAFNDEATEADIEKVVDAFKALPTKIDTITDFACGVNNSPEGLNDGFTHCFLLTFKDEAGRAKYLPHPAHKAFGKVLGPHMKDVFVVDYWGDASEDTAEKKTLRHAVFFKFKDDAPAEGIKAVEQAFAALPAKIDSITDFEWGTNNSPETHDDGFTHCFMVTFDDDAGRAKYLPHPDHGAFVEVLKPVLDKVRVLDFYTK
ncbi:Dabb family protein [Novipirellula artificiosorum]|uniref:Stress responsive A/B Barrel Domain protein n=1 Tax=Novipirellula artificiosorum TaxID=2528016 RepID=A0A5C6DZC6_9BACT|nr:Dabb family protein [Novipirellula artificiosorum]TWU40426.1 Stress responsive A/B Barrel Domain protein [Novipirellula artificiosorum]